MCLFKIGGDSKEVKELKERINLLEKRVHRLEELVIDHLSLDQDLVSGDDETIWEKR